MAQNNSYSILPGEHNWGGWCVCCTRFNVWVCGILRTINCYWSSHWDTGGKEHFNFAGCFFARGTFALRTGDIFTFVQVSIFSLAWFYGLELFRNSTKAKYASWQFLSLNDFDTCRTTFSHFMSSLHYSFHSIIGKLFNTTRRNCRALIQSWKLASRSQSMKGSTVLQKGGWVSGYASIW